MLLSDSTKPIIIATQYKTNSGKITDARVQLCTILALLGEAPQQ
jgi:hypothetical protein